MLSIIAYLVPFLIGWTIGYVINTGESGPIHPAFNLMIGVIAGTVATAAYLLIDKKLNGKRRE